MDSSDGILYFVLVFLLACSAFFSASETAFSSLNKIRLRNYADEGNQRAEKTLRIADGFDRLLSTILVGNNVVNMASASIATVLATKLFPKSGAAVATAVMTVLVLIFGEIVPKTLAKEKSEKVAMSTSAPLSIIIWVLTPVVWVFVKIKDIALRAFSQEEEKPSVTEEELKYIVESIEQEGVLEEQESALVQSALDFDEITVQEILTPRVDILALNIGSTIQEATTVAMEAHYSRIPVYRGTVDSIVGVLQVRDLFKAVVRGDNPPLEYLLTDCVYVHKTMKISALLAELKMRKLHLAVVNDDYGGTMGIVTMEDVLEQLVGDIWDESDEVVHEMVEIGENKYLVSGDMNVFEMLDELELDDREFDSDYNTVGGWAMEMLGHIPEPGEQYSYKDLLVTVATVDEKRIISVQVERAAHPDEDAGGKPEKK